jgi:6-phosphogluconate dehydrogenase, C-terminal domain
LRKVDSTGGALVDEIIDEAEQKGTGRWTAQSALDLGVPLTSITEAVYARALSGRRDHRAAAEKLFPHPPIAVRKPTKSDIDAIRDALYASKIVAYAQGYEQMTAASEQFKWDLKLGEVSSLWRGGCIIRARFLKRIREVYDKGEAVPNLLLQNCFRDAVVDAEPAWRRVVSLAVEQGVPVPAFLLRSHIMTDCGGCAGRQTFSRGYETTSAPTPIAASTRRACFIPAGAKTAMRSKHDAEDSRPTVGVHRRCQKLCESRRQGECPLARADARKLPDGFVPSLP